jgi:hypothetical protein
LTLSVHGPKLSEWRGARQDGIRDRLWRRRTSWDANIDRKHRVKRPDDLVGGSEDTAPQGAVAEGCDQARLRHRLICGSERIDHASGYRPGNQQDVGVAGRGDDVEAEALQVVLRSCRRSQLVLAGVAGPGIDVADGQRAGAVASRQGGFAADALKMAKQDEHAQRSTQA